MHLNPFFVFGFGFADVNTDKDVTCKCEAKSVKPTSNSGPHVLMMLQKYSDAEHYYYINLFAFWVKFLVV